MIIFRGQHKNSKQITTKKNWLYKYTFKYLKRYKYSTKLIKFTNSKFKLRQMLLDEISQYEILF